MVKDAKKRELVENRLARLLDDANKLGHGLSGDVLDSRLDERIEQFKNELTQDGIKGPDAEALVERATLLTRLYVTGPLGELGMLRLRLQQDEDAITELERTVRVLEADREKNHTAIERLEHRSTLLGQLTLVSVTAAVLGLIIALVALVSHR
jgi:hypothetical protein